MSQLLTLTALVFFGSSVINVILNTIKSIVTVKGSTRAAAIMNAITFGFYTVIVKQISDFDLIITVPVTVIANLFGVYLAKEILAHFKKDKIWRISCTVKNKDYPMDIFQKDLKQYNIESVVYPLGEQSEKYVIDIFSKTQGESALIKIMIENRNIKYTVYEIEKTL